MRQGESVYEGCVLLDKETGTFYVARYSAGTSEDIIPGPITGRQELWKVSVATVNPENNYKVKLETVDMGLNRLEKFEVIGSVRNIFGYSGSVLGFNHHCAIPEFAEMKISVTQAFSLYFLLRELERDME